MSCPRGVGQNSSLAWDLGWYNWNFTKYLAYNNSNSDPNVNKGGTNPYPRLGLEGDGTSRIWWDKSPLYWPHLATLTRALQQQYAVWLVVMGVMRLGISKSTFWAFQTYCRFSSWMRSSICVDLVAISEITSPTWRKENISIWKLRRLTLPPLSEYLVV
jgi:hypothetical protein